MRAVRRLPRRRLVQRRDDLLDPAQVLRVVRDDERVGARLSDVRDHGETAYDDIGDLRGVRRGHTLYRLHNVAISREDLVA